MKAVLGKEPRAEEFRKSSAEIFSLIQHRSVAQQISSALVFFNLTAKRADRRCLIEIARMLRQMFEQPNPFFDNANGIP